MSEALLQLAKETEDLALKERESFSPILKKWHPTAVGVAAVTLHNCYGTMLKQYLGGVSTLTSETIGVLHRAGKLEKVLVQMVVEDSADCDDGGKAIVREMVPFEVDSIIMNLLKKWVDERLKKQKECLSRAKESEVSENSDSVLPTCNKASSLNCIWYQQVIFFNFFFLADLESKVQNRTIRAVGCGVDEAS